MTVINCDTCGTPVHCFEGDRGVLVGTCPICGRGYGGAKSIDTGYETEQKKKEVKKGGWTLFVSDGPDDPNPLFVHTFKAYWMAHDSKEHYMNKFQKKWWIIKEAEDVR